MWWGLLFSLVFLAPAIEVVKEWRLHRSADKQLTEMRTHVASGHKWDTTVGKWVAQWSCALQCQLAKVL